MAGTNFKVKNGLEITSGTLVVSNGVGTNGQVLKSTGTGVEWGTASSGSGTVTSITAGTGLSGGVITTSGTIAIDSTVVATLTGTQTLTNKTLTSPTLTTPALGTPASGTLTNCTFPTLNQNTTGYAGYLNTTNQGLTGSTGLTTVSSTTAWSNYPIGYSAMFNAGQTATGAPSSNYGFFIKLANRDAGGGWGGIWSDYSGGDTYVGNTTVSSSYATWYKLLSSTNYNSYAPTLTGTGASGTWGISISGNSATATSAATLTTARTINATSFNGSADITIGSKSNIGTPSAQGTNYYGTIYVSQTATPTGGSTGDLYLVY